MPYRAVRQGVCARGQPLAPVMPPARLTGSSRNPRLPDESDGITRDVMNADSLLDSFQERS